jgi:hypothetical protein
VSERFGTTSLKCLCACCGFCIGETGKIGPFLANKIGHN